MLFDSVQKWIDTLSLNVETLVLANLALALAARYDEKGETSTAGELRKTLNELRSKIDNTDAVDPLADLLKR